MRHTRARRRDTVGGMTTSRDGGRDRCRAYRTLCFVELAAFKALALGFVVVSVVSEYWLEPRERARTVPDLSRAGLWRVEYHVGGVDGTRGLPRSSVSRFWREVERSFRGLGDDAGREGRPGRAYANLFGRSHATRFRVTQATAIAFVFALALEWIVLVFYFARRRERRGAREHRSEGTHIISSSSIVGIFYTSLRCLDGVVFRTRRDADSRRILVPVELRRVAEEIGGVERAVAVDVELVESSRD